MKDKFLLIDVISDLKKNLYIFAEAVKMLSRTAFPYAKDDEDLMKAIKRINRILGHKEL